MHLLINNVNTYSRCSTKQHTLRVRFLFSPFCQQTFSAGAHPSEYYSQKYLPMPLMSLGTPRQFSGKTTPGCIWKPNYNKRPMGLDDLLENQLGHLPKFQKLHMESAFLHQGSKLSLFSLYEQQFPRYVPIFKIAIFEHETWFLAKCQKLHIYPLSTPRVRN